MKTQSIIAKEVATIGHTNQFRRDGTTPYITHPAAIAARLEARGADDTTVAAAWLHDVFEDTPLTWRELVEYGVSGEVLTIVTCLTRGEDDDYEQYLARIKTSPRAVAIKVADMLHNLSDSPTEKQIVKYAKGLLYLLT